MALFVAELHIVYGWNAVIYSCSGHCDAVYASTDFCEIRTRASTVVSRAHARKMMTRTFVGINKHTWMEALNVCVSRKYTRSSLFWGSFQLLIHVIEDEDFGFHTHVVKMRICAFTHCSKSTYTLNRWRKQLCSQHNQRHGMCSCAAPFSLFPFPTEKKNLNSRFEWARAVFRRNTAGKNWTPSPDDRICSDHFVDGKPTPGNPNHQPWSQRYNSSTFYIYYLWNCKSSIVFY